MPPKAKSDDTSGERILNVDDAPDFEAPAPQPMRLEDLPPSMKMATPAEQLGAKPPVIDPSTVLTEEQRTPTVS